MSGPVDLQQSNYNARQALLARAVDMLQPIYSGAVSGTVPGQILNIPARNVGLIKRFIIKITGTFTQSAAETHTLTAFGLQNLLSNVTFTDLSNNQRINAPGWLLHILATARRGQVFGGALTNDSPTGIGSNYSVIKAASTVTTAQNFSMYYEVPLSYGDMDLRGAVYANVVNATMNLQFTFNPNFAVGSGGNGTLACYKSSTSGDLGTLSNVNVTVYQNYLDQLGGPNGQVVLPVLDLSTVYLINSTSAGAIVSGADNPIPYANFRNFMSTTLIYDNNGTLNTGSDINYLSLQVANYTNLLKIDPQTAQLLTRQIINDDMPKGVYYLDHRRRPISTVQFGNQQLIVNPSSVTAGASFYIGYEMLALQNQITSAGSLYGT